MILLDTTAKSLQVLLGGAVATNELVYVAGYADLTSAGTTLLESDGVTTGATAVTPVAAPAASTTRKVLFLSVFNNDTASATVTVRVNNGGTFRPLVTIALAVGSTLIVNNDGWKVIDASGQIVVTTTTGAPSDSDYLVKTADAGLSAERVVTDNTDITFDWSVGGVVKALLGAFTGDITKAAGSLATTIANLVVTTGKIAASAVTFAKMQQIATDRLLGRDTAATGDVEELTVGSGIEFSGAGGIRGQTSVNAQTGTTYTYLTGDRSKLVTHTNAAAIAGTLPQATGDFGAGWYMWVENRGAGTLTITPTTSTIDGAASLALTTDQGVLIVSDGTNYFTMRGIGGGSGTPGGSDTQVQFNDGGAFGGDAGLTYNKTTDALTLAGLFSISGAAAGQIKFPATQNASADANTLDDYEEGSWTPVIGGVTSESGQAYSSQVGRYVKIGKQVALTCQVGLSTLGTITGSVVIKGLPFVIENIASGDSSCALRPRNLTTAYVFNLGILVANTSYIEVRGRTAAATGDSSMVQADLSDTTGMQVTFIYRTDS